LRFAPEEQGRRLSTQCFLMRGSTWKLRTKNGN
jgi:hypothetical protein